jgi:hypothetical protein
MKKFLIFIVLVGAGLSLTASQKGTSVTNLLAGMLPFLRPEVTIDFADNELAGIGEQEILEDYANLELQCTREPSGLGERVCFQDIKAINNIPANTIAFFFENDALTSIAAILPSSSQPKIAEYLNKEYVVFRKKNTGTVNPEGMETWLTSSGIIAAHPGDKPPQRDARMIWKSYAALSKKQGSLAIEMMKLKAGTKRNN